MKNLIQSTLAMALICNPAIVYAAPEKVATPPPQATTIPKIDGFKEIKFGMQAQEASVFGMKCKKTDTENYCSSDIEDGGYALKAATVMGIPLNSVFVSFNKKLLLNHISVGVDMVYCDRLESVMRDTFGETTSVEREVPDVNREFTKDRKELNWENGDIKISHSYFRIPKVISMCNAKFNSIYLKDPEEIMKSTDF